MTNRGTKAAEMYGRYAVVTGDKGFIGVHDQFADDAALERFARKIEALEPWEFLAID